MTGDPREIFLSITGFEYTDEYEQSREWSAALELASTNPED